MSRQHQFNNPKIYSRDEISSLTDQELDAAIRDMQSTIKQYRRDGRDARNFEIEFCYLDNEKQRRINLGGGSRRHKKNDSRHGDRKYRYSRSASAMQEAEPISPADVTSTHV